KEKAERRASALVCARCKVVAGSNSAAAYVNCCAVKYKQQISRLGCSKSTGELCQQHCNVTVCALAMPFAINETENELRRDARGTWRRHGRRQSGASEAHKCKCKWMNPFGPSANTADNMP